MIRLRTSRHRERAGEPPRLARSAWFVILCLVGAGGVSCDDQTDAPIACSPVESRTTETPPIIHLPEISFELGRHARGEVLETVIQVVNLGESSLHISQIKTSCSCTVARGAGESIAPGEVLDIPITIETIRASEGLHREAIRIRSNDPDQPVVEAAFEFEIWLAFLATPDRLRFGKARRYAQPSRSVRVHSTGEAALGEVRAHDPHDQVEVVELQPIEGPVSGFSLIVRLKGGLPVGEQSGELLFETSDPERPRGTLAWNAVVLPDVEFSPKRQVDFGVVSRERGAARSLSVFSSSGRPLDLRDVRLEQASPASFLGIEWQPAQARTTRYEIVLVVRPEAPVGPILGTLVVMTDDPDLPVRRLSLVGRVADE